MRDQVQSKSETRPRATDRDGGPEQASDTGSSTDSRVPEELSLDVVFEILKNSRRREVIRFLREHDGQVALGELAEHIAALENDTTVEALTSTQRKRVYVGLYQCHLPKMDDVGVVEFDQNRGRVRLSDDTETFERYLDAPAADSRIRWHRYYAGVSAVGGVGLVSAPVLSPPDWLLLGFLAVVVVLAMATALLQRSVKTDTGSESESGFRDVLNG